MEKFEILVKGKKYYSFKQSKERTFNEKINLLRRPYVKITEEEYHKIYAATEKEQEDFIINLESIYTFGNADNGWALMPIAEEKLILKEKENIKKFRKRIYGIEEAPKPKKYKISKIVSMIVEYEVSGFSKEEAIASLRKNENEYEEIKRIKNPHIEDEIFSIEKV